MMLTVVLFMVTERDLRFCILRGDVHCGVAPGVVVSAVLARSYHTSTRYLAPISVENAKREELALLASEFWLFGISVFAVSELLLSRQLLMLTATTTVSYV